jgi:hypothetical protein
LIADIERYFLRVDIAILFDHLVGAGEEGNDDVSVVAQLRNLAATIQTFADCPSGPDAREGLAE